MAYNPHPNGTASTSQKLGANSKVDPSVSQCGMNERLKEMAKSTNTQLDDTKSQSERIVGLINLLRARQEALCNQSSNGPKLFYNPDQRDHAMLDYEIYNTITAIQNDINAANTLIFHMERMVKDIAEHDALDSKELIAQIKEKHSENIKDIAERVQEYHAIVAPGTSTMLKASGSHGVTKL